ncbi:P-loop containing nucleoside triphosphate hydrolase protein [Mycena venus]|uniref:P-loop containing nucleoside triphosphate hydrolase protein n=1 Tax=Mycena venus TaxID=2733690 RepID=A0A8H7D1X6_9AGAR|nr:P-loop containing nucleoside triphosphate hydrolase protein [Mycena venus]
MPRQDDEPKTVYIYGGKGGPGGTGGVNGGGGGTGEAPTVNIDNSINNIMIQDHRLVEDLNKWLEFPPETKDRQYHLRSLHHKDTGRWLLQDDRFIKWKATPSSLWIKGISGTGKSVLSSTVIEEITKTCPEQSAVAFFYFDFRNERQRMDIMLRSIIWQLSGRSTSPYSSLERLYKSLGNGTIHPQPADLQGVLEDLLLELDQTYIVIDGLDECHKIDWKPLVQFIHSLYHPTRNAPHILFTSQPVQDFQIAFKDVTFIELGSVVSAGDIRSFVGSEVSAVGNWASNDKDAKDVIEQIVQKSDGMFRMAACLLIELRHCYFRDDVEETLRALPADLFGIYHRFLTQAKDSFKKTVFLEAIFRWLVFSAREITSNELADAIAFCLDDPAFDFSDPDKSSYYPNRRWGNSSIFKLLEGLIVIKKNGSAKLSITLAHSSVKDYILSPYFQQEFGTIINLTKGISHKFIAQTCVRYLLLFADANHLMTKKTFPDYPMSLYAAKYWVHHLQLCDNWDQEALLPSTMHLLEDGSSQYTALYQLYHFDPYQPWQSWGRLISPLSLCSTMGYTAGVGSLLIKHNASVDQADEDGTTALHLASSQGHLDIVQLLIEHSASADQADKDGKTALHLALSWGHLDIVQLLIEHSASVDQADNYGTTLLHLASSKGYHDVGQLLIEHSTSVNQADKDGRTALHRASSMGHLNIVQLLMEHSVSIDQADKDGWTALHLALSRDHLNIIQLLIEHGTSINQADEDGWTALHLASSKGCLNIVQLLIEHGASINQADKDGRTALHLASSGQHLNVLQLLIEHSVSIDQADSDGWTALHRASSKGLFDIVQLLIKHNAYVDQATKNGMVMLHLSLSRDHINTRQLLSERGISIDQAVKAGTTALHLASSRGNLNIVQLLIEHSASIDQADKDGWTALHFASSRGRFDVVQLLIKHSASIDQGDEDGRTALHQASNRGHLNIVQLLIKHGASINYADKAGRTACRFASLGHHFEIVSLLSQEERRKALKP